MPNKLSALFKRNFKSKLMLLSLLLILFLFFTNDFGLIDVEKTAIIVAIGVDYRDDTFEVSCQIVRPSQNSTDQQVVVSGTGKTVADGLNDVQTRTGWYPKLNFCTLLALGNTVIQSNIMETLHFFLRNEQFNDSALLVACREDAKQLLSQKTPLDAVSGYGLQKIITKDNRRISDVISVNLMDYSARYYSETNAMLLPLLQTIETEGEGNAGGGESAPTAGGSKSVLYDATNSAIILENTAVGELDARKTRAYNLIKSKRVSGFYSLENVMQDNAAELAVESKKIKTSARIENGAILYTVKVRVRARLLDAKKQNKDLKDLTKAYTLTPEMKKLAAASIEKDVSELFRFSVETGADIFGLGDNLYKFHNRAWKVLTQSLAGLPYLTGAKLDLTVTVDDL